MSNKVYETYVFENEPQWDKVQEGSLEFSNWDSSVHYNTFFKMCFVKEKGIFLKMRTDETDLRFVNTKRDENIWEDSCMEFFICPFSHREEYLNFEMNPVGAYLCQFGKGREDRVFLASLTDEAASVKAEISPQGWNLELFISASLTDEAASVKAEISPQVWNLELFISASLISEAFGETFTAGACSIRGNFYKCGDLTSKPHYDSFNKMGTLPPGFHNPECFAQIIITER